MPGTRKGVGGIDQRPPVFTTPDATLREAAHALWLESVGVLIVGDEREPAGVLSERDIVTKLAQGADPDTTHVRDAMSSTLISTRAEDPVLDAALEMLNDAIRHLPILDEHGRVVGIVSMRDLVRPLLLDALGG